MSPQPVEPSLDLLVGQPPIVSIDDVNLVGLDALRQVCAPDGRPLDRASMHRWVSTGVRGLKLPAIRVGGRWFSTVAALRWFVEARTRQASVRRATKPRHPTTAPVKAPVGADHDRSMHELRSLGFLTGTE